jgi:hypothetical protein
MRHKKYKEEWGSADLMAIAAFRYCLGRRAHIVLECVEWLKQYWDTFQTRTKVLIHQEIKEAIDRDGVGDKCDLDLWNNILKLDTEFNHKGLFKKKDEEIFFKRGVVVLEKDSDLVKEFISE